MCLIGDNSRMQEGGGQDDGGLDDGGLDDGGQDDGGQDDGKNCFCSQVQQRRFPDKSLCL